MDRFTGPRAVRSKRQRGRWATRLLTGWALVLLAACSPSGDEPASEPPPPPAAIPPPPVVAEEPPPTVEPVGAPYRSWLFEAYNAKDLRNPYPTGSTTTGFDAEQRLTGLAYAPEGRDGFADLRAFSSDSGRTYWVEAEAPVGDLTEPLTTLFGSMSQLHQAHRFRKTAENATLKFTITEAKIEVDDFNDPVTSPPLCPWLPENVTDHPLCFDQVSGRVAFFAFVFSETAELGNYTGAVQLRGYNGHWLWTPGYVDARATGRPGFLVPVLTETDFQTSTGSTRVMPVGEQRADIGLLRPRTIDVDLSQVAVGETFHLLVYAEAKVHNRRARESYAMAYFRDPLGGTGVLVETDGLVELSPEFTELPERAASSPACPVPEGEMLPASAGEVEFSEVAYLVPEFDLPVATVFVQRTGGDTGPQVVTARSTSGGTALAGVDYEPLEQTIVFGDGDFAPREIRLSVIDDGRQGGNGTVPLLLSAEPHCGRVGQRNGALVTIVDDDDSASGGGGLPPPSSGSVGGSVSGLVGTGLVLEERNNFLSLPIAADGVFTFNYSFAAGAPYEVRVQAQPGAPTQRCSVTNGAGSHPGAAVTDVQVLCDPPVPAGALDPDFGVNGRVTSALPGGAIAVALQPDGKLLVLNDSRRIERYGADGSPDPTFGTAGAVTIAFGTSLDDRVRSLVVQPDGRILAVGSIRRSSADTDFAIARLNADGSLDASFGSGGKAYVEVPGRFEAAERVLVQPDGRLVLVGVADNPPPGLVSYSDFSVARLMPDGTLDTTFGANGRRSVDLAGRADLVRDAMLQPDGRIVVVGRVAIGAGATPDVGIARFTADGAIDTSFDTDGIVVRSLNGTGAWNEATAVVVQADGRIVVSALNRFSQDPNRYTVARFEPDGSLDATFADAGVATVPLSADHDYSRAVALDSAGRIVVAGSVDGSSEADFGVLRLLPSGAPDATFGDEGWVVVDFYGGGDAAIALAIQPDGAVVVAGGARNGGTYGLGLVRVRP